MKKIINGKVYDTEKAREVAEWSNNLGWRDFHNIEETLYCKKTGEYFLHGKGGPMTPYAEAVGQNSWSGGSRIMPMPYADAKRWAEEHMDADDYEREFGEIHEDENNVVLSVSLPGTIDAKLRRMAQEAGISISGMIAKLVEGK